ncbi:hypothetical protein [Cerasicoccus frondis]|uniref:hypothetical protein n=1 Tax=Cerasicoccus frondis TaxID=490090 RepID=UPI002852644D|nr:hypothetical protein [Cerasicoccus frondis]
MSRRKAFLSSFMALLVWLSIGVVCANEPVEPVIRHPRLGSCAHFHQASKGWVVETVMPLMADSGLSWIRDEIKWEEFEKEQGVYQIPEKDIEWIEAANAHGLKVLLLFNTRGNRIYENPYDPEAYAKAAAWLAVELSGKIEALEVMNEPFNFKGMGKTFGGTWNGNDPESATTGWIKAYVELLNQAAEEVENVAPKLKIVGLGAEAPANHRMLMLGISDKVDGLADHPYSRRVIPEQVLYAAGEGILRRDGIAVADEQGTFRSVVDLYRKSIESNGGPEEIWITETGFTTYSGLDRKTIHAGFTEEAQGKYLQRKIVEALGLNVEVFIQYAFKDDGVNPDNAQHHFGLIRYDLSEKPAFGAVKRTAQAMAEYTTKNSAEVNVYPLGNRIDSWPIVWDGTRIAAPGSIPVYQFINGDGESVLAIWSAERVGGDQCFRRADVEIIYDQPMQEIEVNDLWTGEIYTLKGKKTSTDAYVLEQMAIPDYPLLLTLKNIEGI